MAYNIIISENTGVTPYFAIYRYEMEISTGKPNYNLAIMIEATKLRYIYAEIQKELEFV